MPGEIREKDFYASLSSTQSLFVFRNFKWGRHTDFTECVVFPFILCYSFLFPTPVFG